jgi:hypothetical protein
LPLLVVSIFFQPRHLNCFEFAFSGTSRIIAKIGQFGDPLVKVGVADMCGVEIGLRLIKAECDVVGVVP